MPSRKKGDPPTLVNKITKKRKRSNSADESPEKSHQPPTKLVYYAVRIFFFFIMSHDIISDLYDIQNNHLFLLSMPEIRQELYDQSKQ